MTSLILLFPICCSGIDSDIQVRIFTFHYVRERSLYFLTCGAISCRCGYFRLMSAPRPACESPVLNFLMEAPCQVFIRCAPCYHSLSLGRCTGPSSQVSQVSEQRHGRVYTDDRLPWGHGGSRRGRREPTRGKGRMEGKDEGWEGGIERDFYKEL